ncbi:MAG TPA: LytTR family transcriptional regulator DNA-binding domain-containing protein [Bacteroidia bacterium]|nr:LytTR family transcriptional regulator DNA-binding domain-containing protein [Bacteroidia bacterium]
MEKFKVVIVEDELIIAEDIKEILETASYEIIGIAASAEEALQLFNTILPDIVLVDVSIKGNVDGIQLATIMREKFNFPFIYITSYTNKSVIERAKLTKPYGYLVKPYKEQDVLIAVELALSNSTMDKLKQTSVNQSNSVSNTVSDDHLFIRDKGGLLKIKFADILFLEADGNYTTIHLLNTKYTLRSTLKNAEEQLPKERFFRIHKSYIINLHEITKIDSSMVVVGKTALPIGRAYQDALMKRLTIF